MCRSDHKTDAILYLHVVLRSEFYDKQLVCMIIDYVKKKTAKTLEICTEIYAHIAIAIIDADTTHTRDGSRSEKSLNTIKITIKRIDFNESDFRD